MNTNNLIDNLEYFKTTSKSYKELGIEFNIHPDSIRYFYRKNGINKISKYSSRPITDKDHNYIRDNFNTKSLIAISQDLNITEKVLRRICKELNLKKDGQHIISNYSEKMYTDEDINYIRTNIDEGVDFLSIKLQRSVASIKKKLWELKIPYSDNTSWSEDEISFLKENYHLGEGTLSFMLDRSYKAVKHMIVKLELRSKSNRKTSIESTMEEYLQKLDLSYVYDTQYSNEFKYRPDFLIPEYDLVIECHGDYWHGNPSIYDLEDLNAIQLLNIEKDTLKDVFYKSKGLNVLVVWESDIQNENYVCDLILNKCKKE